MPWPGFSFIMKILAVNLSPVTTTPTIIKNSCNNISLPPPQSEHQGKKHSMNVNCNLTASHQNMKKLPVSRFFSFIFSVIDTGGLTLLSYISMIFSKNLKWPNGGARGKNWFMKKINLKSKISCQTPVNIQNPEQSIFKPGKETGPGSLVVNLSSTPTGVQTIPIPILGMLMTVCLWWFTVIPFGGRTATA